MCSPDNNRSKSAPKSPKYGIYILASIPIFLFVILPCIISEAVGGYTKRYTSNRFHPSQLNHMAGKNVIVTGANTGIGFETAKSLALAGANVILTTRSKAKGDDAVDRIKAAYREANGDGNDAQVTAMICDQNSLKSVKNFAGDFKKLKQPLHLLVANAGVMKSPGAQFIGRNMTYGYSLTEDGFEQHIGVNHIAHHYMVQLLEKELVAAAPDSRVVSVSSSAHSGGFVEGILPETWSPKTKLATDVPDWYEDGIAYGQSKLANILFAREFASRMKDKGVSAYSLHPGVILSDLVRYMGVQFEEEAKDQSILERMFVALFASIWTSSNMNVETGSLTTLYVATAPKEELVNGGFYWPIGTLSEVDHPAWEVGNEEKNTKLQKAVWEETEKAIRKVIW